MTCVIQRVNSTSVTVDGNTVGSCDKGLLLLLGVWQEDTEKDADLLANKIAKLRIFEDENGKMNRSVNDVKGSVLSISNFTLCANYRHGNRPDYIQAEKPQRANELYEYFTEKLRTLVEGGVQMGMFGADMKIDMSAIGPVTIVMESSKLKKGKNKL